VENNRNYIVYIITCNNDNYTYIGITCQAPELRLQQHRKSKARIGNYIRKYKYENYKPIPDIEFCLCSPSGEIFCGENLQKFCKENNLCYTYVRRMVKGSRGEGNPIYKRYKSRKGWSVFSRDSNSGGKSAEV